MGKRYTLSVELESGGLGLTRAEADHLLDIYSSIDVSFLKETEAYSHLLEIEKELEAFKNRILDKIIRLDFAMVSVFDEIDVSSLSNSGLEDKIAELKNADGTINPEVLTEVREIFRNIVDYQTNIRLKYVDLRGKYTDKHNQEYLKLLKKRDKLSEKNRTAMRTARLNAINEKIKKHEKVRNKLVDLAEEIERTEKLYKQLASFADLDIKLTEAEAKNAEYFTFVDMQVKNRDEMYYLEDEAKRFKFFEMYIKYNKDKKVDPLGVDPYLANIERCLDIEEMTKIYKQAKQNAKAANKDFESLSDKERFDLYMQAKKQLEKLKENVETAEQAV